MGAKHNKYYKGIRERYVQAVKYLISIGTFKDQKDAATKLLIAPAQLNRLFRIEANNGVQTESATMEMIINLEKLFKISSAWVIMNRGEMLITESERDRLHRLEEAFDKIQSILTTVHK